MLAPPWLFRESTNTLTIAPRTGKYTIRLSSSRTGKKGDSVHQSRRSQENPRSQAKIRAQLIDLLRKADYRVKNSKGNQVIELQTLQQESISVSDAFVFLPRPTLAEVFKLTSLVVGYQTNDPELRGKPTAVLQLDTSWSPALDIFRHMEAHGMMLAPDKLFTVLDSVDEVAATIKALAGHVVSSSPEAFNQDMCWHPTLSNWPHATFISTR